MNEKEALAVSSSHPPQSRPGTGLLRSGSVVGGMTLMSRVLGLARDVIFARVLGASSGADAFFVAFRIPNFMRRLFAEGAFAQAFVPVLSEYREKGVHEAVQSLVDRVAGCLGSILVLITALAVAGAPVLTAVFAPGFWFHSPEQFALTVDLVRITFPYLLLVSLTGFAGAILNSYDRFAVPAFTPVLLNLSLITAALMAAPLMAQPAYVLAWGVIVAGVCQLLFTLPFLRKVHLLPAPKVDWRHPGVRQVLWLMAPAMFGVSVSQINLMLDTVLASFLPTGSVSWLYYSDRLVELPNGIFAIALATVIMPSLSRLHASDSSEAFSRTLDWAVRLVLLLALPATLALMILAEPILFTLFQYGEATVRDMQMSSYSLRAYALGLLGFMLIKVLAPGFFARQDMKTPVRIGIIAMVSNMGLNFLFVGPLYYWFNLGHVGLSLATALSAYVNVGLLYRGLRRDGVYQARAGWRLLLLQCAVANIAMAGLLLTGLHYWDGWADWAWWERSARLAALCLGGLLAYLLILRISGVRVAQLRHFH